MSSASYGSDSATACVATSSRISWRKMARSLPCYNCPWAYRVTPRKFVARRPPSSPAESAGATIFRDSPSQEPPLTVLSDHTIKEELAAGRLAIEPLNERDIQPASVDLHLDRLFRIFRVTSHPYVDVREPIDDLTQLLTIQDSEPFIVQPGS